MTHRLPNLAALCLAALIAACGESGPPLTVTDVLAVAPLPGQDSAAAYLTLHNHSRAPITIHRVSSPDFARVEMHENLIVDGVVRMRRLDSLTLDAGTSTQFVSGGKHLMLIEPAGAFGPGQPVTLRFEYDAGGVLIVNTPLEARM